MNRIGVKYSVFIATFFVAIIIFSIVLNKGRNDMTMEMPGATYPVASIMMDSYAINEMHGYSKAMDEATMRESITVIGEDRKLSFKMDLYGQKFDKLEFEVRSVDGERLIENTSVTDYDIDKDTVYATVYLKDLIDENQEYNFIIIMSLKDGREIYYYTRVIQSKDNLLKNKLDFVNYFHNRTLSKSQARELSKYLEPNSEGDNSTFHYVDIHCSLDQVSYGDLNIKEMVEPVITICENGNQIGAMRLNTLIETNDQYGKKIYFVEEYYRVRYTPDRFYLLDYQRTMDEIFTMDKKSFANNKIVLGIQDKNVHMKESEGGNVLAFTNEGRVFCYNVADNEFARLLSFFDKDHFDARSYYRKSEVEILDVDENGNVTFILYGYMNRGSHEGKVGIEVCTFNSVVNTIEEQIFIEYDKSPDLLIRDVEKLSYSNRKGDLFFLLDGSVYKVNIELKTYEKIITNLKDDNFKISEDKQMIVWPQETDYANTRMLNLMNLKTEKITEIKADAGEYLRSIGFMNNDLVYGVVNQKDISADILGTTILPMNKIYIREEEGTIRKEYSNEGIYILDGVIVDNQLTLYRVEGKRADSNDEQSPLVMKSIEEDQITSNKEWNAGVNHTENAVTELYETIGQIELKREVELKSLKFLTPKEVMYEDGRYIKLKSEEKMPRFLVYAKGKIEAIFTDASEAVAYANDNVGTVTDMIGNEIYKRAELQTRNQIMAIREPGIDRERSSLAVCLDTLLNHAGVSRNTMYMLENGKNVEQIMRENLRNCEVLNLSGCSMDAMLYYVNMDIPVLALKPDGNSVLIVGFNQHNVVLMDPENGKIYKKGINDSREMFEKAENQFITYAPYRKSGVIN